MINFTTKEATQYDIKKLLDSSLDIICSINEEGRFVEVSLACEQILGYQPAELSGKKYIDLVLEEDIQKTQSTFSDVMFGAAVTMFENRLVHKNGKIVPIMWSARWDGDDCIMYCTAKNISERKKAGEAAGNEKQAFYDLFFNAPIGMGVLKGPNHVYEMVNPFFLQLVHKTDVTGLSEKDVVPELVVENHLPMLYEVYSTGKTYMTNELCLKHELIENGEVTTIHINFIYQANKNSEGKIDSIFFFAINVTEQAQLRQKIEESEKKYRQIVETAQEGILVVDENNRTVFVNKKTGEILGFNEDEMIGKPDYLFNMEEKQSELQQEKNAKHLVSETSEAKCVTKSGESIWIQISSNPIYKEDGTYQGTLAMITDITNRKMQQLQIEKDAAEKEFLIAELTKSIKDLKHFAYITSHNFRAPLSNLIGLLNFIDYDSLTKSNREIVEMFKTSTQQLNQTINDLIQILIIRNNVQIGISSININKLLDHICSSIQGEVAELGCDINRDLQVENINFHKPYLENILINLLSNTVKYRSPNRRLRIDLSTRLKPDGTLLMIIRDNGIGIDLNRHGNSIFGLYQRFHTNADSVGLGLFIVKSQINALGGSIDVESEPDKGTAFKITFLNKK